MAKRTAIIDLGSNSIRMVIFEKTSRFAFHTLLELKRKVRLGENAYNNGKILQNEAMQRAFEALKFFKDNAKRYKCHKILAVGTSALRDAPNASEFINRIKKELGLNIKKIDGKMESYLGGLAAMNLLSDFDCATTLDIGGGSSELCLIKNQQIIDCISLDLGTVRLKELFFDRAKEAQIDKFFEPILEQIPPHFFNDNLIAIGGSLRAISNAIIEKNAYPLKILHDFSYNLSTEKAFINQILTTNNDDLGTLFIKKERFDTIKEGVLIFLKIAQKLKSKRVITSGVGIREGVFLQDLLRPKAKFPPNFNSSLKSLQDRFLNEDKKTPYFAKQIFEHLAPLHNLNQAYKSSLINAAKLCHIGEELDFYYANEHSAYFILNALNYGFSHKEKALIATIIRLNGKKLNATNDSLKNLLPDLNTLTWLNFILALAKYLSKNEEKMSFKLEKNTFFIYNEKKILNLIKDDIRKIIKPDELLLSINQVPEN